MIQSSCHMGTLVGSRFKPAWWLTNPHLQTLWPTLFRRIPAPPCRFEIVSTSDEDILELDWCGEQGPVVILLHGLTGSFRSQYIRGMQWAILKRGWRSVVLNFRGCGRQPNRSARCYHSGETGDLDFLYRRIRQQEPDTPLAAVGYSLGGNVLLKWLGEEAGRTGLFAACAVSVPLELAKCADRMDRGLSRLYRERLLWELKHYMAGKILHLEKLDMFEEAAKLRSLGDLNDIHSFWEYDDRVIARLYPFRDVSDYYGRCSSRAFLPNIQVPTLLIQARDDPFMTPDVIPPPEETSSQMLLEITDHGGHVGFIEAGKWHQPVYWLEQRIPEFLASRYQEKQLNL